MKRTTLFLVPLLAGVSLLPSASGQTDSRRADLEHLQQVLLPSQPPGNGRINATDKTWEDWVRRTGELPPDFASLPSQAHLPDPLVRNSEGTRTPVANAAQWEAERRWIRSQIEQWVFGRMPPAPDNLRVASSTERRDGGVTIRQVLLEFGPGHRGKLNLELIIPAGPGPFPVFLTNHAPERSSWIHTAVSRGYLACYYQATDPGYGRPDDSDAYIEVYPEYDFSGLARWAWAGSRAVDYLTRLPEVARNQIGIAGHSRNGKQALLAAAFDDRIGAVVASSGLQGEVLTHRHTSDPLSVESIQLITGAQAHWYHPRLRFFSGREHKLPVDQNMLMALVAPRGLMFYSGYSEVSSSYFGSEQAYRDVRRVYRFLDREENIWLHLRPGSHSTEVNDVENFMDFFDSVFGRRPQPKQELWVHGYEFEKWQAISGVRINPLDFPIRRPGDFLPAGAAWDQRRTSLRAGIEWALGQPPPVLPVHPIVGNPPALASSPPPTLARRLRENAPAQRNSLELVIGRPQGDKVWQERMAEIGMGMSSLSYGPGLKADVFYPVDEAGRRPEGRRPVVIWMHPYAHDRGWSSRTPWAPRERLYVLDQRPDFDALTRRGFIVVAFDQIGFGSRLHEVKAFYDRYPQWSLMGKMVSDTRALVDAVSVLEDVDASRIFLLGQALGAKVGLLTAAFDERVRGVVAVSGLFPLRLDTPEKGTEGLRHYSHLHGLLPKLGYFLGHENRVPFDYDEVLALIAPRRVLVVAPELDRYAPVEDVRQEVAAARGIYRTLGNENALELWTPRDFNRMPRRLQEQIYDHLASAAR